jgi:hypothetical protein
MATLTAGNQPWDSGTRTILVKELAGYIEIVEMVLCPTSEMSSQLYVIRQGIFRRRTSGDIENRQCDADWPATALTSGIWTSAPSDERSWPGKAGWPVNHFRVAFCHPGWKLRSRKGNNLGDATDFGFKE